MSGYNINNRKSLFNNFFFNFIKTLSNILFPIITFSYATHILGVEGIGKVNFAKSIISYFIMFAMLGMSYYGTREAAKVRDNKQKLSKLVHELLIINGVSTIISYFILLFSLIFLRGLKEYFPLLIINSLSIGLTAMGMEWLYQALEEYRYITIRSLCFQIIALIIMFLTVKQQDDIIWYTIVSVVASSGYYFLNMIHSRKYISFHRFSKYEICKHITPLLWLFALAISIELYTVLDSTMLGVIKGDKAVGLYTAAVKINKIANSLITSLGVVLIPRLSFYIGNSMNEKARELIKRAYNFVFMFSIPAFLGLFILSDNIILLFSGVEFASAGITMRLLTPIVLCIPFSVVTNQQTLIPMGKEKLILISTCVGAVINFSLNLLLIPRYAENGAAVATVFAEAAVAVVCYLNAKRNLSISKIFKKYYQYWIAALPILGIGTLIKSFSMNYLLELELVVLLSSICYFFILYIQRNKYLLEMIKIVKLRIKK